MGDMAFALGDGGIPWIDGTGETKYIEASPGVTGNKMTEFTRA
jgi:hypothetical protein